MATAVHPVDEILPAPKMFALGLQHVLVMYAGAIAVPLIVGRALQLEPADVAFLISADLFGDWREEVVWRNTDNSALLVYTTGIVTSARIPTLMHNPQYRVQVAGQNMAYNQPPYPSYFLGNGMGVAVQPAVRTP